MGRTQTSWRHTVQAAVDQAMKSGQSGVDSSSAVPIPGLLKTSTARARVEETSWAPIEKEGAPSSPAQPRSTETRLRARNAEPRSCRIARQHARPTRDTTLVRDSLPAQYRFDRSRHRSTWLPQGARGSAGQRLQLQEVRA